MTNEEHKQQSSTQDVELKHLRRIEILIVILLLLMVGVAFLAEKPFLLPLDILIGGLVALLYFHYLAKTMHGVFDTPDQDENRQVSPSRLLLKILVLTAGSVIITLALLIPKFCHPVGYLIGFSAMFIAILFDGVFTGLFGTLKTK